MSEQELKLTDFDTFQAIADDFIKQSSKGYSDMLASAFFERLFETASQHVTQTIELEGQIIDNQLVLQLPLDADMSVQVRDNEILIGNQRIVVKLKETPIYPSAS